MALYVPGPGILQKWIHLRISIDSSHDTSDRLKKKKKMFPKEKKSKALTAFETFDVHPGNTGGLIKQSRLTGKNSLEKSNEVLTRQEKGFQNRKKSLIIPKKIL